MRLLAALLIAATAASPTRPKPAPVPAEPTLTGDPGEGVEHFYSRMISRICTGDEDEHIVLQVKSFISDCMSVGYDRDSCSLAACDKLRLAQDRANRKSLCNPFLPAVATRPEPKRPGVVILCEDGGVYRKEAFIASAGPCVLADTHGGHATAESITVYDSGLSEQ